MRILVKGFKAGKINVIKACIFASALAAILGILSGQGDKFHNHGERPGFADLLCGNRGKSGGYFL